MATAWDAQTLPDAEGESYVNDLAEAMHELVISLHVHRELMAGEEGFYGELEARQPHLLPSQGRLWPYQPCSLGD